MMRLLLVPALLLAACSGGSAPPPTDIATVPPAAPPSGANPGTPPPGTPPAGTPPPEAAPAADAPRYTLVELQNGDHACYVVVKDAAGKEDTLPGSFDLCPGGPVDATPFIGKVITLDRSPGQMAADSCEGDPECKDTQTVDLVVGVRVVPG